MPVCNLPSCSVAWCVTHSSFGLALQKKTTNLKKLIFSYVFSMCVILTFIGCFMWLLLDYSRFLSQCCFFKLPCSPSSSPRLYAECDVFILFAHTARAASCPRKSSPLS